MHTCICNTQELYEFVFSVSDSSDSFTLYKMFPREAVKLGGSLKTNGIEGVLSVAYDENSPDPCDYLHVDGIMSTPPKVKKIESTPHEIDIDGSEIPGIYTLPIKHLPI